MGGNIMKTNQGEYLSSTCQFCNFCYNGILAAQMGEAHSFETGHPVKVILENSFIFQKS
jgi:hypothetical protein